eukprot:TRINITY_DN2244_c0_g1_i2.p1 TRINITY_DN2244_c0_g1~~TRINITY_DN2244_c0_g1_i2.p1  ORF type:complete len:702 (-),score=159.11 TRINITY_DN2244_c0_g1_i2:986-3091(-)
MMHFSLGELIRREIHNNTPLGGRFSTDYARGAFIPDHLALELVREHLSQVDPDCTVLLDGFPRNGLQAAALLNSGIAVKKVVVVNLDDSLCIARAAGRRTDQQTGEIYNLQTAPPPPGVVTLAQRTSDADPAQFKQRLRVYRQQLPNILSYFPPAQVCTIDGSAAITSVAMEILEQIIQPAAAPAEETDSWGEPAEAVSSRAHPAPIIQIAPSGQGVDERSCEIVVDIVVPDTAERCADGVDVCCVIDISGSMRKPSTSDGEELQDGRCMLDIVKHAVSTVMHTLGPDDKFSLVAFNQDAETVVPLTRMSASGQHSANKALQALRPHGQTNIWAGVLAGLEALHASPGAGQKALFLLTDGKPNITPPRGHVHELKEYKEAHSGAPVQINTFGFGYELDSQLLLDLSVEGTGTFAFIPDAPLVGTTFVDALANILSTRTLDSELHLMPLHGVSFAESCEPNTRDTPWGRVVNLGPLTHGQTRQLAVRMEGIQHLSEGEPYLEAILKFSEKSGLCTQAEAKAVRRVPTGSAVLGSMRAALVNTGLAATSLAQQGQGRHALEAITQLSSQLQQAARSCESEAATGLVEDAAGRMSKAVNGKDRFERWGMHYLNSLIRAHQLQQCTNFLDSGLQVRLLVNIRERRCSFIPEDCSRLSEKKALPCSRRSQPRVLRCSLPPWTRLLQRWDSQGPRRAEMCSKQCKHT